MIIKEIKKQINRQTRPKVGNVKIDTKSSIFREKPIDKNENLTVPIIIWDKTYYNKNRGDFFNLNPSSFDADLVNKSYTSIPTVNGSFRDTSIQYGNVRYSGWAGIQGGGIITFKIIAADCSISIWVDGREMVSANNYISFYTSDINLYISDKSFIQIFWYSESEDNQLQIVGEIAKSLHIWEQSDTTPFMYDVQWYTENPIETGTSYFPSAQDYIILRWWFGGIQYTDDESQWEIYEKEFRTLGGFGIYAIEFIPIGICRMYIDNNDDVFMIVPGNHTTIKYVRSSDGDVVEPEYTIFDIPTSSTYFKINAVDAVYFTNGEMVEKGQSRHLRDVPYIPGSGNPFTTVFSVIDNDVEWNKTYYYVIDTYDNSPNKNRGNVTSDYQSILCGDHIAPSVVRNLTGSRTSYDTVTISFTDISDQDASIYRIWEDFSDTTVRTGTSGSVGYVILDTVYGLAEGDPISVLISGTKYSRTVGSIAGNRIGFSSNLPVAAGSGTVIKKLNVIKTMAWTPPQMQHEDIYMGDV